MELKGVSYIPSSNPSLTAVVVVVYTSRVSAIVAILEGVVGNL
jgi:hypothetical protein